MIHNEILNSKYGSTFYISRKSHATHKEKYKNSGIYFLQSIINTEIDITDYNIKEYYKIDYKPTRFTSIKFIDYIENKNYIWLEKKLNSYLL